MALGAARSFFSGFIQLPGVVAAAIFIKALIDQRFDKKRLAIHLALAAVLTSPIFIGFRVIDIHYDTDILPQLAKEPSASCGGSFASMHSSKISFGVDFGY